ncbi:MAG: autotransporter domain-containing protein [Sneathiellaceae bacterium]
MKQNQVALAPVARRVVPGRQGRKVVPQVLLGLLAGVSAIALSGTAAAQGGSYSEQIVSFAKAVDQALHGTNGTGMTAYSHEFADRGIDEQPQVNLSTMATASAVTDCSGWVNYSLNTVAPIHHALLNDSRKTAPFAALGEGSKPYARAMVLQHYFQQMPVVGSSDTGQGFQQITDFAATTGTNSLQAGDVVAYCEGGWCTPERSSGDTGHTFLVTGAPVAIPDEATYLATLGLASRSQVIGRSGVDDTLGRLLDDPTLTVIAVPVIDSSTLTHYQDDRDFGAIPQKVKDAYPAESAKGELSRGGLGSGYILLAVDASGRVRQTRFADGDQWLPNDTAASKGSNGKTFGAVRLTNSIALTSVLTVTKWSQTVDSFGGVTELGAIAVDISGDAGGILLNGGGTLQLTGSNSYGAGTTVTDASTLVVYRDGNLGASSGSLTLDNGTLQAADGFASASRGLILGSGGGTLRTASSSGSAGWAGTVSGGGALSVARGAWTLSGDGSTYAGTARISDGATLTIASGSTLGGSIAVASGGQLSGSGRVGHLTNHGTVAPGQQAALTAGGAYTQTAGGTLAIGLASDASYDSLVVAGPASLDGTLHVRSRIGGYVPAVGTSFTVLEAASVSGTFATVDASFSQTMVGKAHYSGTRVTVTAERDYANDRLHSQLNDPDLRSVGTALNERSSVRSGATHAALSAIDSLTRSSQAGEALHQLQPHNPSHQGATATATTRGHNNRVGTRLAALRNASGDSSVDGSGRSSSGLSAGDLPAGGLPGGGSAALSDTLTQLAAAPAGFDPGRVAPLGVMDAGRAGPGADRPLGIFAYGTGLLGYQDTSADREGYRLDGGGLTVGLDYRLNDRLVVGLAGSYAQTRTRYQGGADTSDAETWSIGPYGMFADGPFHLEAVASYSWTAYDNSRTVTLPTWSAVSNSSPDGRQYSLYGGGGYDFAVAPATTLGPTLSVQYTHADIDGYTETGSNPFNLTVGSQSLTSLQGSLGARLRGTYDGSWGRLLPELRLGWSHEFDNDPTTVTSQLSGGTIPFTTTGDDPIRDWATLGAEVALQLSGGTSLFAASDAQMSFNRENAALSVNAGLRIAF